MKQELTENAGLPAHILWTLAIVAGVTIANQYYNQPLLNLIRQDLAETGFRTNVITIECDRACRIAKFNCESVYTIRSICTICSISTICAIGA